MFCKCANNNIDLDYVIKINIFVLDLVLAILKITTAIDSLYRFCSIDSFNCGVGECSIQMVYMGVKRIWVVLWGRGMVCFVGLGAYAP